MKRTTLPQTLPNSDPKELTGRNGLCPFNKKLGRILNKYEKNLVRRGPHGLEGDSEYVPL